MKSNFFLAPVRLSLWRSRSGRCDESAVRAKASEDGVGQERDGEERATGASDAGRMNESQILCADAIETIRIKST